MIVQQFVVAAKGMEEAGWDGVQLHAAHGYLLAEWMSPLVSLPRNHRRVRLKRGKTNPTPMSLPGAPEDLDPKLHAVWLIVDGIRQITRSDFTISVKLNCSDFVHGGELAESVRNLSSRHCRID